ncbi:hypothetical protein GCM10022409_24750 [Hymenobacter glaciei]|uniref:Uncharacterized protein n=1 Tax=Hymenobacter glaciei TaxID=877209 RepID=A0ABP7U9D4_9BACT
MVRSAVRLSAGSEPGARVAMLGSCTSVCRSKATRERRDTGRASVVAATAEMVPPCVVAALSVGKAGRSAFPRVPSAALAADSALKFTFPEFRFAKARRWFVMLERTVTMPEFQFALADFVFTVLTFETSFSEGESRFVISECCFTTRGLRIAV